MCAFHSKIKAFRTIMLLGSCKYLGPVDSILCRGVLSRACTDFFKIGTHNVCAVPRAFQPAGHYILNRGIAGSYVFAPGPRRIALLADPRSRIAAIGTLVGKVVILSHVHSVDQGCICKLVAPVKRRYSFIIGFTTASSTASAPH